MGRFWKRAAHKEGTSLFLGKQYWSHISSTRKGIVLKEGKSFLYPRPSVGNEFLLKVKYMLMKDVN